MSDEPFDSSIPQPATPEFRAAQRWNIVWVVPVLALLIGGWLIYRHVATRGTLAQISFDTADGIAAGKTEIRCRSVRVGMVENVELSLDLNSVTVSARIDSESSHLLRSGSRFWVVRPRISGTAVSGLGTLVTGAYIELEPGSGPEGETKFQALETPPATSRSIPGRRLVLSSDEAGTLSPGSPIFYHEFEVGRIESRRLDPESHRVIYDAFIAKEYSGMVRKNTRFWNNSGINITTGASGFKVSTPSLQTLLSGSVSFDVPEGMEPSPPAEDGVTFTLHRDADAARDSSFEPSMRFLLLFDQSVRGLAKGSPVEFRGLQIGRVADISFHLAHSTRDRRIPVLVEIDHKLLRPPTAESAVSETEFLNTAVSRGLRASLKTSSLLTGLLYVDLDFYPDALTEEVGTMGDYLTMPTVSGGLAQMEAKLSAILDKINDLPLQETMNQITRLADESSTTIVHVRSTLEEMEAAITAIRTTIDQPGFRELPAELQQTLGELQKSLSSVGPDGAVQGDLQRTLDELRAALRSIKTLTTTLEEKPNSLLFGRDSSGNPTPKAPRNR